MADQLHHVSSSNGSSQDFTFNDTQTNVGVTGALLVSQELNQQILDNSDDCIKVLGLEGQILFMSRGGQALLGIQNLTPFLNTSWVEFWQGADKSAAIDALEEARAGEVHTFFGYRPTLSGEPKWWDSKVSPIRGADGQVERLLCISRDITKRVCAEEERQQAEAALRQSEARFRTLISASSNVLYRMNADWSEMYELQGGDFIVNTSEPIPGWLQKYIHQDDQARVLLTIDAAIQNKSLFELEHRVRQVDGTLGWTYSRAVPLLDSAGEIIEWFGSASDISERKRAEEIARRTAEMDALRVSLADSLRPLADPIEVQAKVSSVLGEYLNANRVAYFEVKGANYVVERDYVNGVKAIAGGYPIDSFGPKLLAAFCAGHTVSVSDVQVDPNLNKAQRAAYAAIQIGAYIGIPLIKNGKFVAGLAVHTSGARAWTPDEVSLAEEVAERTWAAVERTRAEALVAADLQDTQLLHELGARLLTEGDIQTLYQEILSAAVSITRADAGTVQIFDDARQELLILATKGFERNMTEHFYRVNAGSNTSCGIALKNGERSFVDFDVQESEDPDGSMRRHLEAGYLSGQFTPLITRAGKPIGMVSTHWREHHRPSERELRFLDLLARQAADLIEQRQTAAEQEQLLAREQAARAEAVSANRIKDEFLAVLSHELRSPLNPILGWSKLLQSRKLDAAKTQQALQTIERNAHLQLELIEDLLNVSRILQGKLTLNVSSLNLVEIIANAMETVRLAAEAKSIKVEASSLPDVGLVCGDSTRLQQVIWNLLSNAVKFTPRGGQVNIKLERIDSYAYITISDNGKGIAPEFLPYVFDYFRQADATTTRNFGGLGLGLAIVRHLVELHGGTVRVESPGEGQGATFTVRLPLMPTQANALTNSQSKKPSSDLNGIQVLVVDDESDSREFVAFVLEQAGATVLTATTASEALTMLRTTQPNVLLSDIGMPEKDGYMFMQQVRALPREQGGQVSAIALSAYAGESYQQQALEAGFQQHLSKPVEPELLVRAIASLQSCW